MTRPLKTPTVLQMEASECGAAALAMILGHYGRFVPLEQLRTECGISRDGSKANYILRAARLHGLVASGYQVEMHEVKKIPLPAILFWEFNHFVVFEGVKGNQYYINDPALGHRKISAADFERAFTGIVLEFKTGPQFQLGGEKPSAMRTAFKRFQKSPGVIFYFALASLLVTLLLLALPAFIQFFIDHILVQKQTSLVHPLIWFVILFGASLGFLQILLGYLASLFENNLILFSSQQFFWRVLRLPLTFFSQRYVSDLSDRMQSNLDIAKIASIEVAELMLSLCSGVIFLSVMAFYDWMLTGIYLLVLLISMTIIRLMLQHQEDAKTEAVFQKNRMLSIVMNDLCNVEALKVHGSESDFFTRFKQVYERKTKASNRFVNNEAIIDALPFFLILLSSIVIFGFGSLNVLAGDLTIGMLVAFAVLAILLIKPIAQLSLLSQKFKQLNFEQSRINDVMHHPLDADFKKASLEQTTPDVPHILTGQLHIENLTFGYDPYAKPLIENWSLEIKPGDRVAIVGASGSGKSTIAKLICGLYQPWSGQILFDGLSRSQIPRSVLVKQIGYVEQESYFFAGTIWDNLTLWDPSISLEDVKQATQDAQIYEEIQTALDGFHGKVEEGGKNLSGGERQRLEIARALVHHPSILVLDECMSALDPLTEKLIDDRLRSRGCTCILVAHRLSTIRDSQEIIVLESGRVAQRGKHENLIKEEGVYRKLVELEA